MKKTAGSYVLKGDICYSTSPVDMVTVQNGFSVCIEGKSAGVFRKLPEAFRSLPLYDFSGRLVIPGLVDLHIHAPQYAFRGMGMDLELMDWLREMTFHEEAKLADPVYAKKAYGIFCDAMKKSATTHACIFATSHRDATELLMEEMEKTGLFSFVGKVNMDRNAEDDLREESATNAAFDTEEWILWAKDRFQRTKPILTPRFIPSCTASLLKRLGKLQAHFGLPVQSHLSENPDEVKMVKTLVPEAAFYGDAYDRCGLFGKDPATGKTFPTVMAHCVYSTPDEIQRMKDNGVFVAHCPASNTNLSSGIAPIRRYLDAGLRVGLGSDVAGGHSESILRAICDAVQVSKLHWRLADQNERPLTFREAFYLATRGGGAFFGKVGSFEEGFDFSAVVLDDRRILHPMELTLPQRLERSAYACVDATGVEAKFILDACVYKKAQ